MKKLGVSFFTGMEQSSEQNIEYLQRARSLGYEKLFTSLHIPEADYVPFLSDCRKVLDEAMKLGFHVTADVAPNSWLLLGIKPVALRDWGIHTIRIDYGYSPDNIRQLAEESQLGIEVNASSMTEKELSGLLSAGIDQRLLSAGHNYYPRPDTGLSFELFRQRSECFKARNICVSAFIPDRHHPRGPIYAGLPTVEAHRGMLAVESARQYWASGLVDTILFSDPLVSSRELSAVAALPREMADPLVIRMEVYDLTTPEEKSIIYAARHINRADAAEYVVRAQESRGLHSSPIFPKVIAEDRPRGAVTIDNAKYGRYAGELQIVLQNLPSDERVNVVGRIFNEDLCLLDCLTPGRTFCLKEVNQNEV